MPDRPAVVVVGELYQHEDGRGLNALLDPETRAVVGFQGQAQGQLVDGGQVVGFQFAYRVEATDWVRAFADEVRVRQERGDAVKAKIMEERERQRRRIVPGVSMPPLPMTVVPPLQYVETVPPKDRHGARC